MSTGDSPNLFSLRDFRFEKKSTLSHKNSNGSSDTASKNMMESLPKRKRIIEMTDSDSDQECNSLKRNVSHSCTTHLNGNTQDKEGVSNATSDPNKEQQKKTVQLREQMVRYLMRKFNSTQSFLIYEALSTSRFDLDQATARLSQKNAFDPKIPAFDIWRQNENLYKTSPVILVQSKKNHIQRTIALQRNNAEQRIQSGLNHRHIHSISNVVGNSKKKRKVDRDDDSDDSAADYKDRRVFDSDDDSDVEINDVLTKDKKSVLEFFQNASENELGLMASCSKKKAETIIASRPFTGWVDLVKKLQENKYLSTDLLNAAQRILITRNNVKQLMKKCTNLSQQLQTAINNGAGVKVQPALLSSELKLTSYQMVGLNWLVVLHNQGVNGILADEMGLGKTVQVIAFLAHLKEIQAAKHTHLIIVPSSTLENWQNEFERWCPSLKVLLYYGSIEERRSFRMLFSQGEHKEYDVVLTTYTMVSNGPEERKMFRVTPMHYVVFDEAHMLKNMNTQRYESLIRIKASNRILLTGTPLQNNLLELISLLIFVMPNIFSEKTEDLKSLFQKNSKANKNNDENLPAFEKEQIDQAKRIMKPFVLRRLKRDVLKDLPQKTDIKLEIPMVPSQEKQYKDTVAIFQRASENGDPGYNGMTMMSDLRKLSNHPLLLRFYYQHEDLVKLAKKLAADPNYKDTVEQYIIDDLTYMSDFEINTLTKEYDCISEFGLPDNLITISGKFSFLDKKLEELKAGGHRVLIFSQYVIMLNIMEDYLQIRNYTYLRLDGSTPVNIRQQLIDEFTEDSEIFIFLLSTRAGGLGINLTAADTVIIHDIDFNPYNDKQAEDRCHRMGQIRPVTVYRLVSKHTIEEAMWDMTQEKLKLEKEISSEVNENTDVKSVVSLLSTVLGIDSQKATSLVTINT